MKKLLADDLHDGLAALLAYIRQEAPLIHCITNPISINDCANILLALGARPIMAEHPEEVAEIVQISKALALNLGNITDARMASMRVAARAAQQEQIPVVLDLVGVACSTLRLSYARKLIADYVPTIIKGNISELRALFDLPITAGMGVEAGAKELVTADNAAEYAKFFSKKAKEHNCVLLATGPIDLVVTGDSAYTIADGTDALAAITGTGCMANVLAGAYLAAVHTLHKEPILAGMAACLSLGIAAEMVHHIFAEDGPGSFHVKLLDSIHKLDAKILAENAKIQYIDFMY